MVLSTALAVLMALVAVDAVVDISTDIVVMEVGGVIAAVAGGALEDGVVVRICVAGGANIVGSAMIGGEGRILRVIKSCVEPVGSAVAGLAGGGEELRLREMAGVRGVVVIRLMAANARERQRGVVIVYVTVGALARRNGVRSREGEGCRVVVKSRISPYRCVMAEFALLRESGSGVRRIIRAVVILQMASDAGGGVQAVIVVDVAVAALARRYGVRAGESEAGGGVIEGGVRPLNGVVTAIASGRESGVGDGRGRVIKIGLMTANTGSAGEIVIVVDVAVGTLARRRSM